jgi:hypothetical protein
LKSQPRATVLSDIPSLSVFFFLRPNLSNPETLGMWKEWSGSGEGRYTEVVGMVREKLASTSPSTSSEKDVDTETEEWMDGVIESVTEETGMKRSGVVKVLRHALTGRKVSRRPLILLAFHQRWKSNADCYCSLGCSYTAST